jgi:hypothetical protein
VGFHGVSDSSYVALLSLLGMCMVINIMNNSSKDNILIYYNHVITNAIHYL